MQYFLQIDPYTPPTADNSDIVTRQRDFLIFVVNKKHES